MNYQLHCGDCLDIVTAMPDATYSAVFCDPPYGIKFMNKRWDHGVPSVAVWEQVYRVCKPGAILMAFGGTRTWHRLAVNIEDAGWEMFDTIMYMYGSGFPKSMDISKAIDKAAGAEREVVGLRKNFSHIERGDSNLADQSKKGVKGYSITTDETLSITAPATPDAATWHGYGSALKPAYEPVLCFRKPLEGTYAHSALTYGTGAINVDGCRAGLEEITTNGHRNGAGNALEWSNYQTPAGWQGNTRQGRWPANVIHDGSDEVMEVFDRAGVSKSTGGKGEATQRATLSFGGERLGYKSKLRANAGGLGDEGTPARFFYCAKASSSERNAGLEVMPLRPGGSNTKGYVDDVERGIDRNRPVANHHPTVKPLALTEYLARLIVPPEAYRDDAQLLIPYAGVGSEAIGAAKAGWRNITGIELDPEYCEINQGRFAHWNGAK